MKAFPAPGVMPAIAVPLFNDAIDKVKKIVCDANCLQFEKMYEIRLILENLNHTEAMFLQCLEEYGQEICSDGGDIRYQDGRVQCILHSVDDDGDSDSGDDGSMPFL